MNDFEEVGSQTALHFIPYIDRHTIKSICDPASNARQRVAVSPKGDGISYSIFIRL